MLRSMTGYARIGGRDFVVELRAVNHRFCEVKLNLPAEFVEIENRIKRFISQRLVRGYITVTVHRKGKLAEPNVTVNRNMLQFYLQALTEIGQKCRVDYKPNPEFLATLPGLVKTDTPIVNLKKEYGALKILLDKAMKKLDLMRRTEGKNLSRDLMQKMNLIGKSLKRIKVRSPEILKRYRKDLHKRVKQLVPPETEMDLAREVAVFAQRSDVNEEVARLSSHREQFLTALKESVPVGKKLDFILQEMNREVNTVAAKANDYRVSREVIFIKGEIEKLREQVQNIL